ncbi:MAG: chromate transporter [Eubacteriales bacterium]|nr:chromate transporter [Eubacteriales bacterium]
MTLVLRLIYEFFKTGLFSIGGGLATLPFLYAMSRSTGWFTTSDIADMIAISESTPGPLGVNMATYVGFLTLGVFGGVVSTLALVAPSIIVILIIAKILDKFKESAATKKIFYGLRPASTALITSAGLGVAKLSLLRESLFQETGLISSLFNWKCIILAAVCLAVYKKFNLHPVIVIAGAACAGILFAM